MMPVVQGSQRGGITAEQLGMLTWELARYKFLADAHPAAEAQGKVA